MAQLEDLVEALVYDILVNGAQGTSSMITYYTYTTRQCDPLSENRSLWTFFRKL